MTGQFGTRNNAAIVVAILLGTHTVAAVPPLPAGDARVRVAYLIPSNREPQAHATSTLQAAVKFWQKWCRDQMALYEQNPMGFRVETEPDGVTPRIWQVDLGPTDAELRADPEQIWSRVVNAAIDAGVPLWSPGEVWLLVPEIHVKNADCTISGGVALGAGNGSGRDPGVAMLGSSGLAVIRPEFLFDDRSYDGLVIPEIGNTPLCYGASFVSFEGDTLSSISSSWSGAGLHELFHAFGVAHDARNDTNFHGNLMFNGCRGIRGNKFRARYPADETRLGLAAALQLRSSRYFAPNPPESADVIAPTVHDSSVIVEDGQLVVRAVASDSGGLSAGLLSYQYDVVAEAALSGTVNSVTFRTPYYTPGMCSLQLSFFDHAGNRSTVTWTESIPPAQNRAPQPHVLVRPAAPHAGQAVVLDASESRDPESAGLALFEWDWNGDGVWDLAGPAAVVTHEFATPGNYTVQLRVTDAGGATAASTSIRVGVGYALSDASCGGPPQYFETSTPVPECIGPPDAAAPPPDCHPRIMDVDR